MAKYVKGKDGRFAGSVGDGKTKVPAPSDVPSAQSEPVSSTPVTQATTDLYEAFQHAASMIGENGDVIRFPEPGVMGRFGEPVVDLDGTAYRARFGRDDESGMGIIEAEVDGIPVGGLRWNYLEDPPRVTDVTVDENFRRRGIATRLWRIACHLEKGLEHSDVQTDQGRWWAEAVDRKDRNDGLR